LFDSTKICDRNSDGDVFDVKSKSPRVNSSGTNSTFHINSSNQKNISHNKINLRLEHLLFAIQCGKVPFTSLSYLYIFVFCSERYLTNKKNEVSKQRVCSSWHHRTHHARWVSSLRKSIPYGDIIIFLLSYSLLLSNKTICRYLSQLNYTPELCSWLTCDQLNRLRQVSSKLITTRKYRNP